MKIHIAYDIKEGPWGGGNQQLKALRDEFVRHGTYASDPQTADVILFNSFPTGEERRFRQIYNLRKNGATIIHRVDGPVSRIRDRDFEIDRLIYAFNALLADGTVFQSNWSLAENRTLGMAQNSNETVIINAPDPGLFNRAGRQAFDISRRVRLIATSWSPNPRKGFDYYTFLDRHLDAEKYEMTFVGRSPVKFDHIRMIDPLDSASLADELKRHDIFITASSNDPCSNSLIEALHCGLPALVLNEGGHPGIVGDAGETFANTEEMMMALERIATDYDEYQRNIALPGLSEVASKYFEFAESVHAQGGTKNVGFISFAALLCRVYAWKTRHAISFWAGRR